MDKQKFNDWFRRQVLPRWPKWVVNTIILSDWFAAFGRYDEKLLSRVVRRHKIEDDTNEPRLKRILEIVRSLLPPRPDGCEVRKPEDWVTYEQFWQNVRKKPKSERIAVVKSFMKFAPGKAKAGDPEAYKWVVEEGLIKDKGQKTEDRG